MWTAFHPPVEACAGAQFWETPQITTEDLRISDEARGLLDIRLARIIHECRREIASKPGEGERVSPHETWRSLLCAMWLAY
jgi:hypothetical protein